MRTFAVILFMTLVTSLGAVTMADADTLRVRAERELEAGKMDRAHTLFLQAADTYGRFPDTERQQSLCLYYIAIAYHNQQDTTGLLEVLGKMEQLCRNVPDNPYVQYDYHSVMSSCYGIRFEQTQDTLWRDRMMQESKEAVHWQEQLSFSERLKAFINPVWMYYNVAVQYDLYYSADYRDSVRLWLDKARKANNYQGRDTVDRLESDVSIRDLQAWLYYYDGETTLARQEMEQVLLLIDTLDRMRPNLVLTEKGEAYKFFVMLYEEQQRYDEALHYQKLLDDNNRKRFSLEQNRALHEVEAKYERALQEERISKLRRSVFFLIGLFVLTSFGVSLVLIIKRLRKKNKEQTQYEEALEADLQMQASHTTLQAVHEMLMNDFPSVKDQLSAVNLALASEIMAQSLSPLSIVDKRYLLCFLAGLRPQEIAALFHVEPASVYTVRYRLRKKFPKDYPLPL